MLLTADSNEWTARIAEQAVMEAPALHARAAHLPLDMLCRCVSSSSNMLQLSHSGLQPQQLDRVAAAIAAAPWVQGLCLAGERQAKL
jgi:hypothetical protein